MKKDQQAGWYAPELARSWKGKAKKRNMLFTSMLDSGKWVHMLRNRWIGAFYSLFFCSLFLQYVSHLYGICDKMVDYRRIFYRLKSPDFVRKVGGLAPDYPISEFSSIFHRLW